MSEQIENVMLSLSFKTHVKGKGKHIISSSAVAHYLDHSALALHKRQVEKRREHRPLQTWTEGSERHVVEISGQLRMEILAQMV